MDLVKTRCGGCVCCVNRPTSSRQTIRVITIMGRHVVYEGGGVKSSAAQKTIKIRILQEAEFLALLRRRS